MLVFLSLLLFAATVFALWGLVRLVFWRGKRGRGARDLGVGLIAVVALTVAVNIVADQTARENGFTSYAEQRETAEAKAADDARAAGFDNVQDYETAAKEGIKSGVQWYKAKRMEAVADIFGKSLVSSEEYIDAQQPFSKLMVEVLTAGLDGGSSDLFKIAYDVQKLAERFREGRLDYQYVDVMLSVPTLDKYGQASTSDGGTLTWKGSDLAKLASDAPVGFLLRLATEVSLNRFGAEMASEYCKKNPDLDDPRYCS